MGREEALTGTTLRVYAYLLSKDSPVGPREVAKELELVKKTPQGYVAVPGGRVEGFITLGRKLVPRLAFYAALFVGILVIEVADVIVRVTTYKQGLSPEMVMMVVSTVTALTIFTTESLLACRRIV